MRMRIAIAAIGVAVIAHATRPASAEVLDAVYRGTLVCNKLPFTDRKMREAIDVTISGGAATYHHVVRLHQEPEAASEQGSGSVTGQTISLEGSWEGGGRQYKAKYSGAFVRRSARLKGTQTWTVDGKSVTRDCAGAIKRPLKPFLPPAKKKPVSS
jgi:hypothetical protein